MTTMTKAYSIVSNGQEFVFWDRRVGNWNTVHVFEPICLLGEDEARDVAKGLNEDRFEDDPEWLVCPAELTIEV